MVFSARGALVALTILGLVALPQAARAQTTAITSILQPQVGLGNFSLGWEFTLNAPITVTHLGVFDAGGNGLVSSHPVGIFRVSDGALLTSATVTSGDPLEGLFRYQNVAPTTLTSGISYRIAAVYTFTGGDSMMFNATSFVAAPEINFVGERYAPGVALINPTLDEGGGINGYFSANFKFGASVAPEPGTLALVALGIVGGVVARRRRK